MQKDLIDVAMMDEYEEKKDLTKEEKEDLQDISRSEDEGFGIISEGYRFKEDRVNKETELDFKKRQTLC